VESESLVGQKIKKSVGDIKAGSGSQNDIFADMPFLEDVHE